MPLWARPVAHFWAKPPMPPRFLVATEIGPTTPGTAPSPSKAKPQRPCLCCGWLRPRPTFTKAVCRCRTGCLRPRGVRRAGTARTCLRRPNRRRRIVASEVPKMATQAGSSSPTWRRVGCLSHLWIVKPARPVVGRPTAWCRCAQATSYR